MIETPCPWSKTCPSTAIGLLVTDTVGGSMTFGGPFGIATLVGLHQNAPNGTDSLIHGAVDVTVGLENAVNLRGFTSACRQQKSLHLIMVPEPAPLSLVV